MVSKELNKRISDLDLKMKHAFRHGTSAFRFGLILNGISDHLPIRVLARLADKYHYSLFSWNLLADVHLYNNFMNISGSQFFAEAILSASSNNIYCSKKTNLLYYFFSELGQFLLTKCNGNTVIVDEKLLDNFVTAQPSRLARSRDPLVADMRKKQVEESRQLIISLLKNKTHPHIHDFQLAVKHSVELIYHIQDPKGALRWKNRFELLQKNPELIQNMLQSDFICLQECTRPEDIINLLKTYNKSLTMLTYAIDDRTTDHCVLIYDKEKFKLTADPVYYALDGKKPCIFGQFENQISGQKLVVSSIHHPGGRHLFIDELCERIKPLTHNKLDYLILGDFNHTSNFFEPHMAHYPDKSLYFPDSGTMAGSDYGNVNNPIDGVLTNVQKKAVHVTNIVGLPVSPPSICPMNVVFRLNQELLPLAAPSLRGKVGFFANSTHDKAAIDYLSPSTPRLSGKIKL